MSAGRAQADEQATRPAPTSALWPAVRLSVYRRSGLAAQALGRARVAEGPDGAGRARGGRGAAHGAGLTRLARRRPALSRLARGTARGRGERRRGGEGREGVGEQRSRGEERGEERRREERGEERTETEGKVGIIG